MVGAMSKRFPIGTAAFVVMAAVGMPVGVPSSWSQGILGIHNGYVTFTNENPAQYYRIEFKPNLTGPEEWDGAFRSLRSIHTTNATVTVPVGSVYRVVGRDTPWVTETALAADILSGKTAFVHDEEITGTMANVERQIVTPGPDTQTIAQGYHDGTGYATGDDNLLADTIKKGVDLFGVIGMYEDRPGYPVPLPKTGVTEIRWPGEDGTYQMGVPWPTPRFTVQTNTALVLDNLTGLIWARQPHAIPGNSQWHYFHAALDFCENLTFAGHADWRVPNVRELHSLIDYGRSTPALPLSHPFTGIQSVQDYWSSTPFVDTTTEAFGVNMQRGHVKAANMGYLWPVRGGQ